MYHAKDFTCERLLFAHSVILSIYFDSRLAFVAQKDQRLTFSFGRFH